MARMLATKAALSIRVDALGDADGKSEPQAASVGIENRTRLESRLRALEYQLDGTAVKRFQSGSKRQSKFEMVGDSKTYNVAADAVDLVPTQRDPNELAVAAVLDVEAERERLKAERRKAKEAKKASKRSREEEEQGSSDEDQSMNKGQSLKHLREEEEEEEEEEAANGNDSMADEEKRKALKRARKAARGATNQDDSQLMRKREEKRRKL
jgi:nucleolar protein 58